jgi:hypothetical protein
MRLDGWFFLSDVQRERRLGQRIFGGIIATAALVLFVWGVLATLQYWFLAPAMLVALVLGYIAFDSFSGRRKRRASDAFQRMLAEVEAENAKLRP